METIYTIPVNEAFEASAADHSCGCPFCTLYNKLEDDELELVVVATRFKDGNDLKIQTQYIESDPEDIFKAPEKPKEIVVEKSIIEPRVEKFQPREAVTITPQQDRYKIIGLQKREPAYVRRRTTFGDETESLPQTVFQTGSREAKDDDATEDNNGRLIF